MALSDLSSEQLKHPKSREAFRSVRLLVGSYLAISLGAIVALVVLRNHSTMATTNAWVHGIIVAVTALLMASFTVRAIKGSSRAYLRLRIVSAVMVVAIAAIVAIPGDFPLWMKIEQGVCGLLLLGVVAIVNGKHLRSVFTK